MKTPEESMERAKQVCNVAGGPGHWERLEDSIAKTLAQIQRETAEECVRIVDEADVHCCGGYERQDDGRATLRGAIKDICGRFGIDLCNRCGKPKGSAEGCCGCGAFAEGVAR